MAVVRCVWCSLDPIRVEGTTGPNSRLSQQTTTDKVQRSNRRLTHLSKQASSHSRQVSLIPNLGVNQCPLLGGTSGGTSQRQHTGLLAGYSRTVGSCAWPLVSCHRYESCEQRTRSSARWAPDRQREQHLDEHLVTCLSRSSSVLLSPWWRDSAFTPVLLGDSCVRTREGTARERREVTFSTNTLDETAQAAVRYCQHASGDKRGTLAPRCSFHHYRSMTTDVTAH